MMKEEELSLKQKKRQTPDDGTKVASRKRRRKMEDRTCQVEKGESQNDRTEERFCKEKDKELGLEGSEDRSYQLEEIKTPNDEMQSKKEGFEDKSRNKEGKGKDGSEDRICDSFGKEKRSGKKDNSEDRTNSKNERSEEVKTLNNQ